MRHDRLFQAIERLPDMNNIDPVEFGRLQADVHTLKSDMIDLKHDVKALLEMANQGKGGLWMFRTAYVAAGGVVVWIAEHFIAKAIK
jgi:hypothetical protein